MIGLPSNRNQRSRRSRQRSSVTSDHSLLGAAPLGPAPRPRPNHNYGFDRQFLIPFPMTNIAVMTWAPRREINIYVCVDPFSRPIYLQPFRRYSATICIGAILFLSNKIQLLQTYSYRTVNNKEAYIDCTAVKIAEILAQNSRKRWSLRSKRRVILLRDRIFIGIFLL